MTTVHVKNIGGATEDKEIKDFFSFCGKIANIEITAADGSTKNATVTFEKETAARTALLLNQTSLGGKEISVTAETAPSDTTDDGPATTTSTAGGTPVLTQEEKPRARILAEVLAHGYLVAETGLQKALALDEQHGISARFLQTLRSLDERTRARDHARAADATYGLSARATSLWEGLGSYFERASNTPTGRRVVEFYAAGQRQVQDVYNEARRLAELKKEENGGSAMRAVGLDKVWDRLGGRAAAAGGGEKAREEGTAAAEGKDVPGAAPKDAAATESDEKPVKESGVGNPETIH
ncbi:hypothetical protein VTK26DRAFT_3353 [Humicola hyalothermophila]